MKEIILDALHETIHDSLNILPFLFLAYLLMEYLEKKAGNKTSLYIRKAGKYGPLLGGLFGILPQCGFSSIASNMYAAGLLSAGTLISIYLSTSDEMLPLMIGNGFNINRIIKIVLLKGSMAAIYGFLIDLILPDFHRQDKQIDDLCKREHCHCEEDESILKASLVHTLHIFIYILVITFILNLLIAYIGEDNLALFLQNRKMSAHLIAGMIGLIPNCAASLVITELYLNSLISFGTMMSGLFVGAGVGILILYRINKPLKENILLTAILYLCGISGGLLLDLMGIVL